MLSVLRPFAGFDRDFDRVFFDMHAPQRGRVEVPTAEVFETDESITVRVDLPGVMESDIQVTAENGVLTVKAVRNAPDDKAVFHVAERSYGALQRSFKLPGRVDTEKAEAAYEAGVLRVTLPRRAEAKSRTITVKHS